jgi:hypothetical protein
MSLVLKVPNLDWDVTPQITQVVGIVVVGINVGIVVIGITVTCNIGIVIFRSRDCSSRYCYPTRLGLSLVLVYKHAVYLVNIFLIKKVVGMS